MNGLKYILFLSIYCLCIPLYGQKLHFNPDTAFTAPGGLAKIQLELSPPIDIEPEDVNLSSWESLVSDEDTIFNLGWQRLGTKWVFPIRLMFLDTGFMDLPPLTIDFSYKDEAKSMQTQSGACIIIGKFPLTNQQLSPIKDIIAEPPNWRDFLTNRVLFGIAAFLLLLATVWYFFFRKKKTVGIVEKQLKLSPKDLALKRLEELRAKAYPQEENWKMYYSQLTFILRDFLEAKSRIKALESTSDEILNQLKNHPHNGQLDDIRRLLQRADLVKFAKGLPPLEYHAEAMEIVRRFISKTG